VILVDLFGEQALQWVPEISVSRFDIVRLEDLQTIATGFIEQKRVQAIKDELPAPLVNPMTAHESSPLSYVYFVGLCKAEIATPPSVGQQ